MTNHRPQECSRIVLPLPWSFLLERRPAPCSQPQEGESPGSIGPGRLPKATWVSVLRPHAERAKDSRCCFSRSLEARRRRSAGLGSFQRLQGRLPPASSGSWGSGCSWACGLPPGVCSPLLSHRDTVVAFRDPPGHSRLISSQDPSLNHIGTDSCSE